MVKSECYACGSEIDNFGVANSDALGHSVITNCYLAAVVGKATSKAADAASAAAGKPAVRQVAAALGPKVQKAAVTVLDAAAPVAKQAAKTTWGFVKPGGKKKGKAL